jgi:multidrug resistance protein MdtO
MVTARDRIIGILLGNLVVYLTFTTIWPVSVVNRIGPEIAALLRKFGAMLTVGSRAAVLVASEAQVALGALERDLELATYEPASIRPGQEWLDRRRKVADDLAALAGALLLSSSQDPTLSRDMSARFGQLANGTGDVSAPDGDEPKPAAPATNGASPLAELRGWIEAHSKSLEELQAPLAAKSEGGIRAPV